MNPTEEQQHILDLSTQTEDNLLISALAGTGKTSTLELIERAVKTKPILYSTVFVLLALTFGLNFAAIWVRSRIRRRLRLAK